jgi:hypothetical protein
LRVSALGHYLLSDSNCDHLNSFAEGYITIVVSYAPAIYSFWSNYFINAALYSTLRSVFTRSIRPQPLSLEKSEKYAHSNQCGVTSDAKVSDDYHLILLPTHQGQVKWGLPLTDVETAVPSGIQKSTAIIQSTQAR